MKSVRFGAARSSAPSATRAAHRSSTAAARLVEQARRLLALARHQRVEEVPAPLRRRARAWPRRACGPRSVRRIRTQRRSPACGALAGDQPVALEAVEHARRGRRRDAGADGDLAHGERAGGVEQRVEQLVLGERQIALAGRLGGDAAARAARRAHELAEGVGERLQLGVGGGRGGGVA